MTDAIQIKSIFWDGRPILLIELFGAPLASTTDAEKIREFKQDPDGFRRAWGDYFAEEVATLLAERIHQNGRTMGWLMATSLAPRIT